jgi:hypothetical protein
MRMKEDAMRNGQTKPGYNLQISTENQYITKFDFYSNPTDTLSLIPFMELPESRYNQKPEALVSDSGYGSEENYAFLDEKQKRAYVKYNWFHKEQKRKYRNNAFLADNLYYNEKDDYFVCPMGQHMHLAGKVSSQSENGYRSQLHIYQAQRCTGCPQRGSCHKSKGNGRIKVNHVLRS